MTRQDLARALAATRAAVAQGSDDAARRERSRRRAGLGPRLRVGPPVTDAWAQLDGEDEPTWPSGPLGLDGGRAAR